MERKAWQAVAIAERDEPEASLAAICTAWPNPERYRRPSERDLS